MPSTNGYSSAGGAERIALYLRVSSEEQRDRETIEIQRKFLNEYCRLYGLEAVEVYADDGVSGTVPLHERPEGRRLLADAREGKFDTVLVYKLDRLGRTLLVIVDAHDRLQAEPAGASLRSAREPIDTSNPSGRLIFQMLASFAEYDRENIRERTQAGMHRAFRNGKHGGRIPYGYDVVDESGTFEVVEHEAHVVREVIANVAAGASLYAEAVRLNDRGEPSPGYKYRGRPRAYGPRWGQSTIRGIVHRTAYAGTHMVNTGAGAIEREVPAIVDPALREKALSRLKENKRYSGGKPGRSYLLRGLVYCDYCGTAYVGASKTNAARRRYHYYNCCGRLSAYQDKREAEPGCPAVQARWLEELVWADVRSFLHDPGEVLERVKEQMAAKDESDSLEKRRASLTKRLATKQAEKDRYVRLYATGHLDEEELDTYLADVSNQVENLKLLISSVEADLTLAQEEKALAASTEAWLKSLRENLEEVEVDTEEAFAKRRELVKLLVEKIAASRDEEGRAKVDITYRFGPPAEEHASSGVSGEPNSVESDLKNVWEDGEKMTGLFSMSDQRYKP
jgi:site-specific DNA recombinase